MRRLWRRAWSILSGRDRQIRRRLGLLALGGLVLTACTHYTHEPRVSLDQHRADLEACRLEAKGLVLVTPIIGQSPVVVAANGVGVAVTIVEEYQQTQREFRCMEAKGYRVSGLTFSRWGYK
jgi:hypothetical protein